MAKGEVERKKNFSDYTTVILFPNEKILVDILRDIVYTILKDSEIGSDDSEDSGTRSDDFKDNGTRSDDFKDDGTGSDDFKDNGTRSDDFGFQVYHQFLEEKFIFMKKATIFYKLEKLM
ncbi:hypothetical protein CDAR_577161 [Caerostris darwini]|uniref:Uncharacterized protein n=1 Tax=Caerostris darwini TaxID=1538125 RepID=A0AAV4UGV1_9ARAC|nr:hypothetical protein CDAR_577161 [Caerostris darwini]